MEVSNEFWQWIDEHRDDDPLKLRLKWHGKHHWIGDAIMQIECRNRSQRKLHKTLQNNRFLFPTLLSTEQCTSDDIAEVHTQMIGRLRQKILDMTCGLGIDAFHFASAGHEVTAIELVDEVADAAQYNALQVDCEVPIRVMHGSSSDFLKSSNETFDVIFIDPARRGDAGQRMFALKDCQPDVTSLLPFMRQRASRLFVKASPMLDVAQTLKELPGTTDIYVIGNRRECKELVAIVDLKMDSSDSAVVHVWADGIDYSFRFCDEYDAKAEYVMPEVGGCLYEPMPSVMKAGPFKLLSQQFGVKKLNQHTHLYYSDTLVPDFPGTAWKIKRVIPFASKEIKKIAKEFGQLDVATRNFGMSAEQLRAKLRVKEGGNYRLIGAKVVNDQKYLFLLER